ncbi:MAG: MFS transporter [Francisellaceae bacterium]|jgi:MFS family permease|nr:MFS transporter [Francisellaceae bacterium]MBT6539171.1 MFS transporter [Francisellaceae bacterium]
MKLLTKNPWIVVLSAAMFFCFEFIQINMFNVIDKEIMRDLNVDGITLSWISSMYFYGNILLLLPAGLLLDRFSTRKLILFAMVLSIIGTIIFALSTNIYTAGFGRFLVGVSGGPFCFLSTMRLASRWFPEEKLAFVIGSIVSIGMIGGLLAQTPFAILVEMIGWRYSIGVNVCFGIFILGIIALFVFDYHPDRKDEYERQRAEHREVGFSIGLSSVASKSQNWFCGAFASLLNLPIFILGALWGNLYLHSVHNLTWMQASYVSSMLYVGMLIGSPLFGMISDNIRLRKAPMFVGIIICFISVMMVMQNDLSLASLLFWFLVMGFGSSSQIICYPTIAESNSLTLTGSAESLSAMLIMSGGAVFQPVFGYMIEKYWDGFKSMGVPVYTADNYHFAMYLFPITIIISAICAWKIKETFGRRQEDNLDIEKVPAINDKNLSAVS